MWWQFVVWNIPFVVVIFFLLRFIQVQRTATTEERRELLARICSAPPAGPVDTSFVPMDDPRMGDLIDHIHRSRRSSVGDVEGDDS